VECFGGVLGGDLVTGEAVKDGATAISAGGG